MTDEPTSGVEAVLAAYEAQTRALPLGAHSRERGDSAYNWRMSVIKDLRELAAALATPAASPATATCNDSLQVQGIPRAENTGRYLAETNDGRLLYLNHANQWQEMPNILRSVVKQDLTPPASPSPSPAAVEELVALPSGRSIWEVANQLEGWVGPDTEENLAQFLIREGKSAAELATALSTLAADKARIEAERDAAQRLVNQLSDDITFLRKRRGDLVREKDAAEARASTAESEVVKLRVAIVTTAEPLEAMRFAGSDALHCAEIREGIERAVTAARAALSPAKETTDE